MLEILHKTNIDFMGWKKFSFALSAVMIILGIFGLIQISRGKANLGIDFVGGTTIQLDFKDPVAIDQTRAAVEKSGFRGSSIQQVGEDGNKILIRLRESEGASDKIQDMLRQEFPDNSFEIYSIMEIGPAIGRALQQQSLWAVTVAVIGIIIYIAFRFQFKFGVAAAVATVHDVLTVLAVFYLMNKEINLLVITALLTLAGYSLTDTVVVFDRIRENLKKNRRESLINIVNQSLNEVLSRTIVTSITVILVLIPLVLYGGEVLHDFALALLMGVVVGTYSSVFVASPLLAIWQAKSGGRLITK